MVAKYQPQAVPKPERHKFDKLRKDEIHAAEQILEAAQQDLAAAGLRDKAAMLATEMESDLYVMEMLDLNEFCEVVIVHLLPGLASPSPLSHSALHLLL